MMTREVAPGGQRLLHRGQRRDLGRQQLVVLGIAEAALQRGHVSGAGRGVVAGRRLRLLGHRRAPHRERGERDLVAGHLERRALGRVPAGVQGQEGAAVEAALEGEHLIGLRVLGVEPAQGQRLLVGLGAAVGEGHVRHARHQLPHDGGQLLGRRVPRLQRGVARLHQRVGERALEVAAHHVRLGEAAALGRGLAHAVEHGQRLVVDRGEPGPGRAQVIEHRRLLLLHHAVTGVQPAQPRRRLRQDAAARQAQVARARQVEQRALRLGLLLAPVLGGQAVEIRRRHHRGQLRVELAPAEHVLLHRDRVDHVARRVRAGRAVVAAAAHPAERQVRAGQVGRAIAVDDAGVGLAVEALEALVVAGEHAGGQAEASRAHDRDRLVVVGHGLDAQVGAEQLLVGVAGDVVAAIRQDVQRRAHEEALAAGPRAGKAVDKRLGAGAARRLQRGRHSRPPGRGGQRAGEAGAVIGIAEAERRDQAAQEIDETSGEIPVDQDPLGRGAALPGGEVGAQHQLVGGLVEVGVVEHDRRVLAAHLQGEQHLGAVQAGLGQEAPDPVRACEAEPAHGRVRDQCRAGLRSALHHVEHAGGQAGGVGRLGVALAGQRRDVARLDHHRVAGEQRRDDVGVTEMEREVERPDHADHAERVMAQLLAGAARHRAIGQVALDQLVHQIEADQQELDLGGRLAAQLAGLHDDGVCQIRGPVGQRLAKTGQMLGPLGQAQASPGRGRLGGRITRLPHAFRRPGGLQHASAGAGRVCRHQGLAGRGQEPAGDVVAERAYSGRGRLSFGNHGPSVPGCGPFPSLARDG